MVKEARSFNEVATEFFTFIEDKRQMLEDGLGEEMNTIILVAHNGKQFDLLFLMEEMKRNDVLHLIDSDRYGYAIDTMILAKNIMREKNLSLPVSYKLSALFEHVLGQQMDPNAHRALVDVKATSTILRYDPFWEGPHKHVFFFRATESDTNDGDSDSEADVDSDVEEDEITEDAELPTSVLGWEKDTDFDGYNAMQKFNEVFEKHNTRHLCGDRTGLQCSVNSVNSPLKAWRQIFTNSILDKIVLYTNQYRDNRLKEWVPVSRQDILDFISILFLSE